MFGLGTTEILIIGGILLLIFGAKKLPEIGKGLGGAIREFKDVKKDINITTDEKGKDSKSTGKEEKSMEGKLTDKVLEEIPGIKKGMEIKKKVEKITEITK
jgi:sec-independent protein translocase protein TatA